MQVGHWCIRQVRSELGPQRRCTGARVARAEHAVGTTCEQDLVAHRRGRAEHFDRGQATRQPRQSGRVDGGPVDARVHAVIDGGAIGDIDTPPIIRVHHDVAWRSARIGSQLRERTAGARAQVEVAADAGVDDIRVGDAALAATVGERRHAGHRGGRDVGEVVAEVGAFVQLVGAADDKPQATEAVDLVREHVEAGEPRVRAVEATQAQPAAQRKFQETVREVTLEGAEIVAHRVLDADFAAEIEVAHTGGAAVALVDFVPGLATRAALPCRTGVLGAAEDDVADVIVGRRVQLADAEVAVQARPGVKEKSWGEPEDPAVVGLEDVAVRVKDHIARVRVRRGKERAQGIGDVIPRPAGGVAAEDVADKWRAGLTVTRDVDTIRIRAVGKDREMYTALSARIDGGRRADGGPGHTQVGRAQHAHQARPCIGAVVDVAQQRCIDRVAGGRADRHFDAGRAAKVLAAVGLVDRAIAVVVDPVRGQRESRIDGDPVCATVVAAENTLAGNCRVEPIGIAGVGDEVAGRAGREVQLAGLVGRKVGIVIETVADTTGTGDQREVGAAVDTAVNAAAAVDGSHQHDLVGDRGADRRGNDRTNAVAAQCALPDLLPGSPAVRRSQQSLGRSGWTTAIEATGASKQRTVRPIERTECQRTDRKRRILISQRRPIGRRGRGVGRLPNAAHDAAGVQDVCIRRMGGQCIDRARHGVIRRGAGLTVSGRRRPLIDPVGDADQAYRQEHARLDLLEQQAARTRDTTTVPRGPATERLGFVRKELRNRVEHAGLPCSSTRASVRADRPRQRCAQR